MPATFAPSPRLRIAFVLLALALAGLTASSFYRFGSAATDENLFTAPPSPVYLERQVGEGADAVPAGSFPLRVGDRPLRKFEDWAPALSALPAAGTTRLAFAPAGDRNVRLERTLAVEAVRAALVRDASREALVVAVVEGGASDRAGMRVGDLIVRIGGRTFNGIFEADAIMRGGGVGRAYAYDVLRDGRPLVLDVVLARFGVPLQVLFLYVAGLLWMAFGTWLLWMRPTVTGARLLGLAFVLAGFGVSMLILRRDVGQGTAYVIQTVLPVLATLVGIAAFTHSNVYFPREWPTLSRARWLPAALYGTAIASWLVLGVRPSNLLFGLAVILLATIGGVARWIHRAERPAEDKPVRRVVKGTGGVAVFAALSVLLLPGVLAGAATPLGVSFVHLLSLASFPAAYLYTIGRYRIFGLQLRVRRNVQYSVVSFVWVVIPFAVLLWLLWTLPQVELPLPRVRMTRSAIEVLEGPPAPPAPPPPPGGQPLMWPDAAAPNAPRAPSAPAGGGNPLEKGVLMVVAIGLAFGLRAVALRGQRVLDSKFHRGGHDYRRATQAIGEVTSTRLDLEGLTAGLLDTIVTLLPLKRAGLVLLHGTRTYCASRAHGIGDEAWQTFCREWAADALAVMRDARSEIGADYAPPRLGDALRAADFGYLFPLRARDTLVGVIFVGEKQSESAFQNDDWEFLATMASQAAGDVENAFLYEELAEQERLKHELQIARQIQMASLPQFTPEVGGLDVAGVSIPAHEVGGDYFDYLDGRAEQLTVMVGDVSGKGTSAALHMSRLQGIVRSLHAFDLSPRELFSRTNQLISRDLERRSFVTALGGFFDTSRRVMVLARAGHLPLYVFRRRSGAVERWLPRGLGFGLSSRPLFDTELEERQLSYEPGDVFLFVTDGVIECQDGSGDLFGEDRLQLLLAAEAPRRETASALRDALAAELQRFVGDSDPYDDQTIVVVRAI